MFIGFLSLKILKNSIYGYLGPRTITVYFLQDPEILVYVLYTTYFCIFFS